MKRLRIVFMGTPDFSVPTLQKLHESEHEIVGVVTQPDKQRGRGKKVSYSPVKEYALQENLPVYQPESVKSEKFMETLRALNPDILVVIAYGKILPEAVLNYPKYGAVNVHASLLPKYRGAAPIHWAILNGDKEAGVTIMQMDIGMDTGDMLLTAAIPVEPDETTGSLFEKLSVLGAQTLLTVLSDIETYRGKRVSQDEREATYAQKITKDMGHIDWTCSAEEIERYTRGLAPAPGMYTTVGGQRLKIWKATVCGNQSGAPGEVLRVGKKSFLVACGNGSLEVLEVQPESRKRLTCTEYLQQAPFAAGDILG